MASSGPPDDGRVPTESLGDAVDREFFRSLVENNADAIVTVDTDSQIRYANDAVERVFGYEPEELIGEPLTTIMPERFRSSHFAAMGTYLDTGEQTIDWTGIELPAEHRDGHEVPLSITFAEYTHGGERLFSGIMRDVTDRVERQRELERQNERLERFAGLLSHDLRSPLQRARSAATLARHGDEAALDELDEIYDQMADLIDDALALAKHGQAVETTEPVSLTTVAETAWEGVETDTATLSLTGVSSDANDTGDTDETGDTSDQTVDADPDRLRRLLSNLFRNAVEHGGDEVTVRVESTATGFAVADDGVGFDETPDESVFDYGHTTDVDGTGFGLSIVRDIAEAHAWRAVAAESTDGGARVEIHTEER